MLQVHEKEMDIGASLPAWKTGNCKTSCLWLGQAARGMSVCSGRSTTSQLLGALGWLTGSWEMPPNPSWDRTQAGVDKTYPRNCEEHLAMNWKVRREIIQPSIFRVKKPRAGAGDISQRHKRLLASVRSWVLRWVQKKEKKSKKETQGLEADRTCLTLPRGIVEALGIGRTQVS